jgi:hypothetical protein
VEIGPAALAAMVAQLARGIESSRLAFTHGCGSALAGVLERYKVWGGGSRFCCVFWCSRISRV